MTGDGANDLRHRAVRGRGVAGPNGALDVFAGQPRKPPAGLDGGLPMEREYIHYATATPVARTTAVQQVA
nr:hypothetical protein [Streptomyces sp. WAC05374]